MQKKKIEKEEEEVSEEIQKESKLKKAFIIMGAVFIALLVASFVFVNYPIGSILGSNLGSSMIISSIIDAGNFSISLENGTYGELKDIYFQNQKTENAVCMLGYEQNSIYHIKSLYQPEILSKSFSQVVFHPCSKDTLIMLHTHPYKECLASETDIRTLNETKQENHNILMVIMCESSRVAVYS